MVICIYGLVKRKADLAGCPGGDDCEGGLLIRPTLHLPSLFTSTLQQLSIPCTTRHSGRLQPIQPIRLARVSTPTNPATRIRS